MSGERAQRTYRTSAVRRLGKWSATLALGGALAWSCYQPMAAERRPVGEAAPRSVAVAGTTFAVELAAPIDSNMSKGPLDAIVIDPIRATDGSTIVSGGAAVAGRATGLPGPNGGSLRLELDSIDTVQGMTTLFATLAPRQRDASLAATEVQGPGLGYDALLDQPPAASIRLRAGARLDLMLTRPLAPAPREPTD
jgi:hypothetical protein